MQLGGPDDGAASIADDISGPGLGCGEIICGILLDPVGRAVTGT